jgi:hypothetical protein
MIASMTLIHEITGPMTGSALSPFLRESRSDLVRHPEGEVRPVPAPWINFILPLERGRSTSQMIQPTLCQWESDFVPRTPLGRKLWDIRNRAIAAGIRLLTEDEVLEEVRRRRGEIEDDEKDLY